MLAPLLLRAASRTSCTKTFRLLPPRYPRVTGTRALSSGMNANVPTDEQRKGRPLSSSMNATSVPTDERREGNRSNIHFRLSPQRHPLNAKAADVPLGVAPGSHFGQQQNHVWQEHEIEARMKDLYHHIPVTYTDQFMHTLMMTMYHSFNALTGFQQTNTPVKAVEWRLIVLESVAGVPGFVAAGFRHFRSLRNLERDHGWIHTLLEEAENERMHLLTCLKMFNAGPATRGLVVAAQITMTPFLFTTYLVNPKAAHRFVGYLEETACETYKNVIIQTETPGTPLFEEWSELPAPAIAKGYWKLHDDALWVDALKCMFADECNHRDVNHTFSTMDSDDPNPFVEKHKDDAAKAWYLETAKDGEQAFSTVGSWRRDGAVGTKGEERMK